MTFIEWYALGMTVIAAICGCGWHFSHSLIKQLADVDASDWPLVRQLIKGKL